MSDTATAYRCSTRESSTPAAVEVAVGPLTARPSPLARDGSLAQARVLPAPRTLLPPDAALRAVLGRARLVYPAGFPVMAGQPGALVVRP